MRCSCAGSNAAAPDGLADCCSAVQHVATQYNTMQHDGSQRTAGAAPHGLAGAAPVPAAGAAHGLKPRAVGGGASPAAPSWLSPCWICSMAWMLAGFSACTAPRCSVPLCRAALQRVVYCCTELYSVATCCIPLQRVVFRCNVLHCTAACLLKHGRVLQHRRGLRVPLHHLLRHRVRRHHLQQHVATPRSTLQRSCMTSGPPPSSATQRGTSSVQRTVVNVGRAANDGQRLNAPAAASLDSASSAASSAGPACMSHVACGV